MSVEEMPRRTQDQRSAATRQAVLEATIASLIEQGHAGTTLSEIQVRSGVSRGAITHQFPLKEDILVAATHHLANVRLQEIAKLSSVVHDSDDRIRQSIALLWEAFNSELFHATVELWNASRTDDVLHAALFKAEVELGEHQRRTMQELLSDDVIQLINLDKALRSLLYHMRGAAMTNILRRTRVRDDEFIDECVALFCMSLTVRSPADN